jgi:hypothetical protein
LLTLEDPRGPLRPFATPYIVPPRRNDPKVVVLDNRLDGLRSSAIIPGWTGDRHPNLAGYNVIATRRRSGSHR